MPSLCCSPLLADRCRFLLLSFTPFRQQATSLTLMLFELARCPEEPRQKEQRSDGEATTPSSFLRCRIMRNIGYILGITLLATVVSSPLPAAAFGIHLGPFYFHVPFAGHHHRHRLQTRPKEEPNNVSRVPKLSAAHSDRSPGCRRAAIECDHQGRRGYPRCACEVL